jgi:serine/threonine protein kinase
MVERDGSERPCIIIKSLSGWRNGARVVDEIWDPLEEREIRSIMRQLVDMVSFIHGKGYAHNDINVIVTDDSR